MTRQYRKKLIEVALPLEAINKASAREKSIRHGHPSTLHLWWARRPLAAARAVIFAQMVDDPSSWPNLFPTEEAQEVERQRLFRIIEELVLWESTTNEKVLQHARDEIWRSWRRTCAEITEHDRAKDLFNPEKLPAFHDPFAGGGALPLEAQRLGLEAFASDLNPVAVLINKAMTEIPSKFAGKPPVNPVAREKLDHSKGWLGSQGLAEDLRFYGSLIRDEAEKRLGHLYPPVEVTASMAEARPDLQQLVGQKLRVVAWLWARTVRSPNPAFADVDVPLASTFIISTRAGHETYVEPVIRSDGFSFSVRVGTPPDPEGAKNGTKLSRGANFQCLMSKTPISGDYIKSEGRAGRMGARLMAIVAEGERGRHYLSPTSDHEAIAKTAVPEWTPDTALPNDPRNFWTVHYGLTTFADLFTNRQLVALTTLADLALEMRTRVRHAAVQAGVQDDGRTLATGGAGATAYAEAVSVYLSFALSKLLDRSCTLVTWFPERDSTYHAFGRQALPMSWDYAETNVLGAGTGSYANAVHWEAEVVEMFKGGTPGIATQADAQTQTISKGKVISTDPPYYDNIAYADLSGFFYVWLRRSLRPVFPDIFATVGTPTEMELVATPYRHGGKEAAEAFFLKGMTQAITRLSEQTHPAFPVTIYYAFRQSETDGNDGVASTGWETFLGAVIASGFSLSGTWPARTELANRVLAKGTNALASSIVLVCRPRSQDAVVATRSDFRRALKSELPFALKQLQKGNIAPVDLAQAAIGPGMSVFSRYAKVIDASGEPVSVREALAAINQVLDEALAEQEGDFDADTRWALAWFDQFGFAEGDYGIAETLSKAKNTSVAGLVDAGLLSSSRGKVRLLRPEELSQGWDPRTDPRLTAWEAVHHLVRILASAGENGAAELVEKLGNRAESARELAYRLYTLCERRKRAPEALAYNSLVQSWPEVMRLAREGLAELEEPPQATLFGRG